MAGIDCSAILNDSWRHWAPTKACRICKRELAVTEFHRKRRRVMTNGISRCVGAPIPISICKPCHRERYGLKHEAKVKQRLREERGPLLNKRAAEQVCWLEQTCIKCGIMKPYTEFQLEPARGRRRTACKTCRIHYTTHLRRASPRMRARERDSRRDRYKADPKFRDRLARAKRDLRASYVAKGLTVNGTPRKLSKPKQPKPRRSNLIMWLRRDDGEWGRLYHEAVGRPWNWHGHSKAEAWRVRYALDGAFRATEILKVQTLKVARANRIAMTCDGSITAESICHLFAEAKFCPYCMERMGSMDKSLDHVEPLLSGGAHSLENVVVCCKSCNYRKGRKSLIMFMFRVLELRKRPAGNAAARSCQA